MNKKMYVILSIVIVIILLITFLVFGKNANSNHNEDKPNITEKISLKDKLKINLTSYEWKSDVMLNDIKEFSAFGLLITNQGELYRYSINKLFSNNQNTQKVETDKKFNRFINGALITVDNKIYGYIEETNKFVERMDGWTGGFVYNVFDKYNNMFQFGNPYLTSNIMYSLVENNIYYNIILNSQNNSIELFDKFEFGTDEIFIRSYSQALKTNKAYYKYGMINTNDYNKYADVTPIYGPVKISNISNLYSEILYFDGTILIFKDDINHIYLFE